MSDEDRIIFPFAELVEAKSSIRLFPAAEPDPGRLALELSEDEPCYRCGKVREGFDDPQLILVSTDSRVLRVFCSGQCLVDSILAALKPQPEEKELTPA